MKLCNFLLLCLILLTACRPAADPILTTRVVETAVSPTLTATTPAPTAMPTPAPTVTPIISDTPFTYTSEVGGFTMDLPANTAVYEAFVPSVDGVLVEVPNSVSFIQFEPNFALIVEWIALAEVTSLDDFVTAQSQCVGVSAERGETVTVDGHEARLYAPTGCGAVYTSYLYTLTPTKGYILTISSMTPYRYQSDFIWETLNTFTIQ